MRIKVNSPALMPAFAGGLMAVVAALGLVGLAQGKTIAPSVIGAKIPSSCDAIPGNLVANCGFETESFTGWTEIPATSGSDLTVQNDAHSGNFAAFFGALTPEDTISQSIPTIAGDAYSVSFFLMNQEGTPIGNQFNAMFGSTNLLSLTDSGSFGFTEFTDTVVATGSSTTLSFAAFQVPAHFILDDVSVLPVTPVTAVPEPASLVLLGSALLVFGVTRRRRGRMGKTPSSASCLAAAGSRGSESSA